MRSRRRNGGSTATGSQRLWVYVQVVPLQAAVYEVQLARLPVPQLRYYNGAGIDDSFDTATKFLASVAGGPAVDVIPQIDDLRGAAGIGLSDPARVALIDGSWSHVSG